MPWLGGTWPYVEARHPSLLVSVWYWWGYGQSFDLIHLLIPCLSVASHMARCGWDVMEMLQLTAPSVSRQKRGLWINTSKRIPRSEVTSVAYFWWLVNHDWVCAYAFLCVNKRVCMHVPISKQGTSAFGETSTLSNLRLRDISSNKHWIMQNMSLSQGTGSSAMHSAFMPWFVMKLPCCCNEFNITLGRIQLNLRWSKPNNGSDINTAGGRAKYDKRCACYSGRWNGK